MIVVELLAILALRVALQVVLFQRGFEALTADEFARVLVSARWAADGEVFTHGPWPPLQFYLLGTALWLHHDLVLTPRLFAGATGLCGILVIHGLGARLGGRRAGLLAAFALAVHPSHLWISSTALSEGLYATLWMSGVLAVLSFEQTRRPAWLLAAAAAFAAGGAVRLEGWLVTALFAAYLLFDLARHRSARAPLSGLAVSAVALAIACAFPIAWTLSDAAATGVPFGFLLDIERYKVDFAAHAHAFVAGAATWLGVVVTLDPFVFPAALAGVVLLHLQRNPLLVPYALLAVAPGALFLVGYRGHPDPWVNHVRYLSPYLWALLPLAAYGVVGSVRGLLPAKAWRPALLAGCCALAVWQGRRALAVTNDATVAGLAVGREIARLRDPVDPGVTLLEMNGMEQLAVHAGADDVEHLIFDRALDRRTLGAIHSAVGDSWPAPWRGGCDGLPDFAPDRAGIARCVRERDVRLIAVHTDAARRTVEQGLGFPPVAEVNGYAIYRVSPPTPDNLHEVVLR